jgi:hypothetical protein
VDTSAENFIFRYIFYQLAALILPIALPVPWNVETIPYNITVLVKEIP